MTSENKEVIEEMAMAYLDNARIAGTDKDGHDLGRGDFEKGVKLIEKLKDIEEMEMEAENKAERIEADRERNESQERIEQMKQNIPWKKVLYDMMKVALAAGIPAAVHFASLKRCANLEEHGRWTSKTSQMELNQDPKIIKDVRF